MLEDHSSSSEGEPQSPMTTVTIGDISVENDPNPPPKTRFRNLESVIESTWKELVKKSTKQPRGKAEIEHYISMIESAKDDVDVLQYWVDQQVQFPLISKLALDILVIPASSAPVNECFLQLVRHALEGETGSPIPILREKL